MSAIMPIIAHAWAMAGIRPCHTRFVQSYAVNVARLDPDMF